MTAKTFTKIILKVYHPKAKADEKLLSLTKNYEILFKQTKRKPQQTTEKRLNEPIDSFSLESLLKLDSEGKCLLGLTNLEVFNSVYFIVSKKINFIKYIPDDELAKCAETVLFKENYRKCYFILDRDVQSEAERPIS